MDKWQKRVAINEPVPGGEYDDRRDVTYAQLRDDALRVAGWLREQGIGAGDKVAIGGHNSSGWITSFIATHLVGGVPVCLNSTLMQDVQIHCLSLAKPKVVLVDANDYEVLKPVEGKLAEKGVGKVYSWDSDKFTASPQSIEEVKRGAGYDDKVKPDSDALVLFTSGTTSLPKAVLITQQQAMQHVLTASIPAARAAIRMGATLDMVIEAALNPPEEQIVALMPVPLFHVTGLLAQMIRVFVAGTKMIFLRRWSVPDAAKLIVKYNINVVSGVPAITTALLQSGLLPKDHKFDAIAFGGAPPPKRLQGDVRAAYPDAFVNHGWGMTEAAGLFIAIGGGDYVDYPESVGLAIPIGDMRIVDIKTGKPVPAGTLGVLQIRGGCVMKEYLNNEKATREAFPEDGWFDTGDVGYLNDIGLLFLRDRAKDMIIRGGENIASAEVENAVTQDGRIEGAAAVPVPDPVLGERVGLGVSLAPGATATPESIIAEADKRLRYPARPVVCVIFPDGLRELRGRCVKGL